MTPWSIVKGVAFSVLVHTGCATTPSAPQSAPRPATGRCTPALPCWPTPADWKGLASKLTGKLEQAPLPTRACAVDPQGAACSAAKDTLKNPYAIQDQAGGTESVGWLGAWSAAPSAYAVAAETPDDIVAAVNFAREHRLRVVIKGTGHDYLGRSNAPDSLLIWTHKMRKITVHESFVAEGCSGAQAGLPAVTLEAGTRWLEAYEEVTGNHHRYVQGGGCTSVGAAGGFIQGGGFGSWSKKYGIAAASMLEAEVVTADGKRLVANSCQNSDLFWALRGGGGGTFGVVTRVTLMTHPLPSYAGFVVGSVKAKTDAAFRELLEHFLEFYTQSLHGDVWGEQVHVRGNNTLDLSMSFLGMNIDEAKRVWQPFRAWVEQRPDTLTMKADYVAMPGDKMWDHANTKQYAPDAIVEDKRPGQFGDLYWWADNQGEVATYWYAYQSRWLPLDRLQGAEGKKLAGVLFDASRHWSLEIHFNKGQAGAAADAVARDRTTSMNPAVLKAAALVIAAATGTGYPGVAGSEPDMAKGEEQRARVGAAMKILRDATPGAGSYVNETDYFEPNWQEEFWGENYPKLLAIKQKYDPGGLFTCHHCVGSEEGSETRPR